MGGSSSVAERQLPKLNVAGSIPVSRSSKIDPCKTSQRNSHCAQSHGVQFLLELIKRDPVLQSFNSHKCSPTLLCAISVSAARSKINADQQSTVIDLNSVPCHLDLQNPRSSQSVACFRVDGNWPQKPRRKQRRIGPVGFYSSERIFLSIRLLISNHTVDPCIRYLDRELV